MIDAQDFATKAGELVGGDREKQHGDKTLSFAAIARMWTAWLDDKLASDAVILAEDVAHMMLLLKMTRTHFGSYNQDDYVDMCGYAACAGEIAAVRRQYPVGIDGLDMGLVAPSLDKNVVSSSSVADELAP